MSTLFFAYLSAFTLFWTMYAISVCLWALKRRRETRRNIRARLVVS